MFSLLNFVSGQMETRLRFRKADAFKPHMRARPRTLPWLCESVLMEALTPCHWGNAVDAVKRAFPEVPEWTS